MCSAKVATKNGNFHAQTHDRFTTSQQSTQQKAAISELKFYLKDKTTRVTKTKTSNFDIVYKPSEILVTLGTGCEAFLSFSATSATLQTQGNTCAINSSVTSFSFLVKLAGQLYRKFTTIPMKMKCPICPMHYPFGHSITIQVQIL